MNSIILGAKENKMLEIFSGFLSSLKQTSPAIFLGLSIATGLMLFGGDVFVSTLGLENFLEENKSYIGIVFIVSLSILLAQGTFCIGSIVKKKYENYQKEKVAKIAIKKKQEQLHDLTPAEKAYLIPYVIQDENTQYFLIEDGIAGGLLAKKIIYQASQIGDMRNGWAYNIQPWAKRYLKDHLGLLEGEQPPTVG